MREILLTSSVLILTLLLLRRVFRNTVSRRVQYGLWALVLVRLLVPVTLPAADFSVVSVSVPVRTQLETLRPAPGAPVQAPEASPRPQTPSAGARPASPTPEAARPAAPTVREALPLVWRAGMAVMACWVAGTNLRFWRILRKKRRPLPVEGCRYRVFLVEEGLASPCLFGLWRPAVYLTPAALASQASLEHVLAHEETHARHLDPLWSLLRCVCLIVYWFDPLVWWAAQASRTDCELACDEGALARLGEAERIPYGRTLLSLIPVKRGPGMPLLTATTMTAGKKRLKERITRIAEHRRTGVLSLCLLLVLVTAACAATFTGGGEAPAPGPVTEPVTTTRPSAAPEAIDREPVLSIPLTDLEPYEVEDGRVTAEDFRPGTLEPDTVSADTMGEVLVDKTLSDGTRIVCYWDPDPENQYTKYWAIRDGDTLLRFYKEDSGYNRDYDVGEYTGLFDHDGFILYAPRGGAYFAIDYWYLDEDGMPRMLADCSNRVIRADWNGDGEDDLMWFYHDSPYLYFRRDGVLHLVYVLSMVEEAWPEAQFLGYDMPEDDSGSCLEIYGYVDAPSKVEPDGFTPVFAPREVYFQGDYMNLYKPLEPVLKTGGRFYSGIDAPEEVLEAAKLTAAEEFDRWQEEGIPGDVDDWRISRLDRVETPEVSDSRRNLEVECYRLDYEFHAATPGDVVIAGGVTVYEDGWFNGFAPGTWLLFQVQDGKRELLDADMVCDTAPDSEAFKAEYAWALKKAGVLAASALESEVLFLDFCYMPVRFLNDLARWPSGEQSAALEKLASFLQNAAIPEEYAREYPTALEMLEIAVETGELTDAARALYERLPAGDEGPAFPTYVEDTIGTTGGSGSGSGLVSPLPPATPGSLSIDPLDYGITDKMLTMEEDPRWDEMDAGALCAYYLHSDGAGAEGSSDELYRRFLSTPQEVLDHLAALGDQAAPHGNGRTAVETLCGAIASADVFWYDCAPEFADVMERCRKVYSSGPVSQLLDAIEGEHAAAMARSQMAP